LVNGTWAMHTVALGDVFRKIRGTQDPQVNDGATVTQVTLPPRDALILLRVAPSLTPTPTPANRHPRRRLSLMPPTPTPTPTPTATFLFVSPLGNDNNDGTEEKPFKTIQRAKATVRAIIAAGMNSPVYVILRQGSYFLTAPLVFDENDSGRNGHTVTYMSYPGEEARLIGGSRIIHWERHDDKIYKVNVGNTRFSVLFENGRRATPAREPNSGYFTVAAPGANSKTQFHYDDRQLREPFAYAHAQVYLWNDGDWSADLAPITSVDFTNNLITLDRGSGYTYDITKDDRYFVQHSLDFLDAPGEFYLDEQTGLLYYYPRTTPISAQEIIVPKVESVLVAKGSSPSSPVSHIEFRGLTIMVSDAFRHAQQYYWERNSGLIHLENAEEITVRDSKITSAGSNGIVLKGFAKRNLIYGNLIEHTGGAGIWLQGPDPRTGGQEADLNSDNSIMNNYVRNVGELIGSQPGILVKYSARNLIRHNKIGDTPYSGIILSGMVCQVVQRYFVPDATCEEGPRNYRHFIRTRGNVVEFNEVTGVMRDSSDGGGIYTWATAEDNVINNNSVHSFQSPLPHAIVVGIYIDDGGDYTTISNNIIYGISGRGGLPVYLKGVYNAFLNNIVINDASPNFQDVSRHVQMWAFDNYPNHHLTLKNNIFVYNQADPSFRQVYRFNDWSDDKIAYADNNVFWHRSAQYTVHIVGTEIPLDDWRSRYHFDGLSLTEDPMFRDIASYDFTVNNQNVLNLGFKNIDQTAIGLLPDFRW